MTRLSASQQLAVLSAALFDSDVAIGLLDGPPRHEPLRALEHGPPRQLGALLAWYSASILRHGLEWLFARRQDFDPRLALAQRRSAPAVVWTALADVRPAVDFDLLRHMAVDAACAPSVMREEGEILVGRLRAVAHGPARVTAGDVGLAIHGEAAA